MFKLGKITIAVLAALVLGALVLSPASLFNSLRASRDLLQDSIEDAKPDVQHIAEIRVHIRDLESRVDDYADRLADLEGRQKSSLRKADELRAETDREKSRLTRAKQLLDSSDTSFVIGGRSYSREALNADALARVQRCRDLDRQQSFYADLAGKLDNSLRQGRAILIQAKATRGRKLAELQTLEARLENAKLLQQVRELTDSIHADPLGPQTELARKFERLTRKADSLERRASTLESHGPGLVDWDGPTIQPDARTAIADLLQNSQPTAR